MKLVLLARCAILKQKLVDAQSSTSFLPKEVKVSDQKYEMAKQQASSMSLIFREHSHRKRKRQKEGWKIKDLAKVQGLQIILLVYLVFVLLPEYD